MSYERAVSAALQHASPGTVVVGAVLAVVRSTPGYSNALLDGCFCWVVELHSPEAIAVSGGNAGSTTVEIVDAVTGKDTVGMYASRLP